MMTQRQKELDAKLDWWIRTRNGFYCQGKRFTGITYHAEGTVDLNNYDGDYFIVNAIVDKIETIIVNGKRAKNLILSQGFFV